MAKKGLFMVLWSAFVFVIYDKLEQGPDEDRTKSLQKALKIIWEKTDPLSPGFKRYPFDKNIPIIPPRLRALDGSFIRVSRLPPSL